MAKAKRAKRSSEIRVPDRRKRKYSPRPHPEVTAALEAEGLIAEHVYRRRRWDDRSADREKINRALARLVCMGWDVGDMAGLEDPSPVRLVRSRKESDQDFSDRKKAAFQAAALSHARRRGLAFVFDRPADPILRALEEHRQETARLDADPIYWLSKEPALKQYLTKGELGALANFVGCHNRFYAAIGHSAYTLAAGTGVPMTEEAIAAIEKHYRAMCADILRMAGRQALSRCQDIAGGNHVALKDWQILQAAAHAIDQELPAIPDMSDFEFSAWKRQKAEAPA